MRKIFPIVVAAGLLVVDGVVYGLWTNRWRTPDALNEAVGRLDQIPMTVGDWEGKPRARLSEREAEAAGFSGYTVQSYTHRQTGRVINIMLACGSAGPLAVHTPEVCYRGAGYEVMKAITRTTEEKSAAELFQARFGKPDSPEPTELRVHWTWNAAGAWRAPDNPRWRTFAGSTALFKLYVIQETMPNDEASEQACSDFLGRFLPEVNGVLFPRPAETGAE